MGAMRVSVAEKVFTKLEQPLFEHLSGLRELQGDKFALAQNQEFDLKGLGDLHEAGVRLIQGLPVGSTPAQVTALHTAGGRLSNALEQVRQARTLIDEAGGYGFGAHLNGGGAISSAPKGSFPGIERQHRLLVIDGLAKPSSNFETQKADVEAFWRRWRDGGPARPTPPLDRKANAAAIAKLQDAFGTIGEVRGDLLKAGL